MKRYNNHCRDDGLSKKLAPESWKAADGKRYKQWKASLGEPSEFEERTYPEWIEMFEQLESLFYLEQFTGRLFHEVMLDLEMVQPVRTLALAARHVQANVMIDELNKRCDLVTELQGKLRALGVGSISVGYIADNSIPDKQIDKANKIIEQLKSGEIQPRKTGKHGYMSIQVGNKYRLLNKGDGYELLSHECYNRVIDE
ncbi:hypothetical protein VCR15J2_390044 [Vibrio coralliirubri]|uniref:ParE family toxin-like protein n=1 Tax=Vibrio coralliirubri TaxID=1516159 RepID=UPI0006395D97|nr:hypothetical protein [Vibrio coralliirubri]CDT53104.1 hypothetical protein VCR15J2_390044 [Vibrio coralliirubri]